MESDQKRKRYIKNDNTISLIVFSVFVGCILLNMSVFVQPTPSTTPKTKDVKTIATFYAAVLVIMVVAQLFTFDDFLKLVTDFGFPGGIRYAHFLAAILVTVEVFALPFLLRMSLSPAFRFLSMVCGWLVALIWAKITLWLAIKDGIVNNIGFLGTVVNIMPGWWAIFIAFAFGILAAWASWGMWPRFKGSKRVTKHVK
jgi:hypothetical protein